MVMVSATSNDRAWPRWCGPLNTTLRREAAKDIAQQSANASAVALTEKAPLLSTSVEHAGDDAARPSGNPARVSQRHGVVVSDIQTGPYRRAAHPFSFLRDDVTASQDEERIEKLRHIEVIARAGSVDDFLKEVLRLELNIVIAGGTSTGKTELGAAYALPDL
ncbi:hypothetical protein [Loktanella sp. M215]|uniref:hypothetical protein n=1 Tax=Loktanella sp. M215 TaxID=2675431 RepID=UPI001F15B608|nr:hypothetical protein [Loktanella sp. M215]MCF7701944.1 hypothetical protein [Loktanella sp. M215]